MLRDNGFFSRQETLRSDQEHIQWLITEQSNLGQDELLSSIYNHYEILNVKPDASQEEIKISFRNLVKKFHTDFNKDSYAENIFKSINEANEVLSDTFKRGGYDDSRHTSGYDSRNNSISQRDVLISEMLSYTPANYYWYRESNVEFKEDLSLNEVVNTISKNLFGHEISSEYISYIEKELNIYKENTFGSIIFTKFKEIVSESNNKFKQMFLDRFHFGTDTIKLGLSDQFCIALVDAFLGSINHYKYDLSSINYRQIAFDNFEESIKRIVYSINFRNTDIIFDIPKLKMALVSTFVSKTENNMKLLKLCRDRMDYELSVHILKNIPYSKLNEYHFQHIKYYLCKINDKTSDYVNNLDIERFKQLVYKLKSSTMFSI